ncbi:Ser/Thr protein phosphatase [Histomonas meleagridis]|uniref:Ser/Thr protein phosphatase n=1 Tax=Histomonas meleagridis TaxID=135588 RepID=UPI00355A0188|nr:Ser/Thr protein phosphatase [Histomonas meleagridis]KAH0797552.1 Ser/Thr protein phosphatase [Histomonas meleagridis]
MIGKNPSQQILEPFLQYFDKDFDFTSKSIEVPEFDINILEGLCNQSIEELQNTKSSLIEIDGSFAIVGDLHGNIKDLIKIFHIFGVPPETKYLFLGDFVDRGQESIAVVSLVLAFVCLYPGKVFLIRGNHEFSHINRAYGFYEEIMTKYNSEELWLLFQQVFSWFPLAAIIQNKIFCVHGGLSPLLNNVQTLRDLSLPIYNYLQNSMISDLVWSDPNDGIQGFHLNHRGSGQVFGPDTVDTFLRNNNLQLLIRGHQCTFSGFRPFANFEGVTLFSSSEYCMTFNNKCGVITFRNNEISFYCLQEDFDCDIMPQATMCLQVDEVILLGDSKTGKSCILKRFTENVFEDKYFATIGIDGYIKKIEIEGTTVNLNVFDISGDEKFRLLIKNLARGRDGIIFVYDVTNMESFHNLDGWMEEIDDLASRGILLVGNKVDLQDKRVVTTEEGQEFADKHEFSFIETSAKDGYNVKDAFQIIAETIMMKPKHAEMLPTPRAISPGDGEWFNNLVIDFESESLCVSLVKSQFQTFDFESNESDTNLSGKQIDQNVMEYVIKKTHNENIKLNTKEAYTFMKCCEEAKFELLEMQNTKIFIGKKQYVLTRDEFIRINKDLFGEIIKLIGTTLDKAHMSRKHVDHIILVGKCWNIPNAKEMIKDYFGKEPIVENNKQNIVAVGALMKIAPQKEQCILL